MCAIFFSSCCVCVYARSLTCALVLVDCIQSLWFFFSFVLCTLRNFMRLISMLAKRQQQQQQINLFRSIHFILKFSICCFWRCHCFVVISSYIWVYICIYTVLQTSPYYSSTAHSAIQVSKTYTLVWLVLDIFSFCLLLFYSMCIRVCALFSSPVRASIQFSTKKEVWYICIQITKAVPYTIDISYCNNNNNTLDSERKNKNKNKMKNKMKIEWKKARRSTNQRTKYDTAKNLYLYYFRAQIQ